MISTQGVTLKGKALTTKCMFQDYSELLDNFTRLVLKTAENLFVPSVCVQRNMSEGRACIDLNIASVQSTQPSCVGCTLAIYSQHKRADPLLFSTSYTTFTFRGLFPWYLCRTTFNVTIRTTERYLLTVVTAHLEHCEWR